MKFIATIVLCAPAILAQDFVNLTFNNPDLNGSLRPFNPDDPRPLYIGDASRLFRGWTILGNGAPLGQALYQPGGGALLGPVALNRNQDNFNAFVYLPSAGITDLAFRQTGRVPANMVGLNASASGYMELLVNGELVGTTDPSNVLTTFNIARFAGQTVTLDFHLRQNPPEFSSVFFDIAGFTQVPEPSTWALFGVGAAGLAWVEYRRRKA